MRRLPRPDWATSIDGHAASRRALIGGLPVLLGAARTQAEPSEVRAGKRKRKKRRCCTGGKQACQGACRDLRTDNANCGGCGTACAPGDTCFGGLCLTGAGTCAPTTCRSAVVSCNGGAGCFCRASMSGTTRCGMAPPDAAIVCGTCTSDAQCVARYGHAAFCSDCCGGRGGCAVACPG